MRWIASRLGWMLAGALLAAYLGAVVLQQRRPPLAAWHRHAPAAEFRAGDDDADLAAYRAREQQVFGEVEALVAAAGAKPAEWNRYSAPTTRALARVLGEGRTAEVAPAPGSAPRGVAVLLHGLSDSPYSLHAVADRLADDGWQAIVLRLPGHATVPAALLEVTVEDWRAAVDLALREVGRRGEGQLPLLVVGYSNGAALALDYALRALDDPSLPRPRRLVFLSPGFAVSGAAAYAPWLVRLSHLPGLGKLGWTDIEAEPDPFKYNSFTVQAGAQIWRLTSAIEARLGRLADAGRLGELPPVLAVQSVVDATIPPRASLRRLFGRLRGAGNELVLFDVNRLPGIEALLAPSATELTDLFENSGGLSRPSEVPFTVTLLTNAVRGESQVEARTRTPGRDEVAVEPLALAWPPGVYSLSHVAIPFPPDDPIYGATPGPNPPFPFGAFAVRGETGTLRLPASLLSRQRYNPFFSYLAARLQRFARADAGEGPAATDAAPTR